MNSSVLDYKLLLLENYRKIGLNENEVMVILVMDVLLSQGNSLITADLLSLKMSFDVMTIDQILANLLSKGMIEFVYKGNKTKTTLDPLKEKLFKQFEKTVIEEEEKKSSDDVKKILNNIYTSFSDIFSRDLTPIEKQKIEEWILYGYSEKNIIESFKEAFSKNKKTLRSIEKILVAWCSRDDLESEGQSPISKDWNKNLEETIRIAKTPWIDSDDDK